jgi:exopolysaccharide biosynthesis polyprenyl glycosylphosphotransferase
MLRQFSRRRIVVAFVIDWLGTLAMLALAVVIRSHFDALPESAASLLRSLGIPFADADWQIGSAISLPRVGLLVALAWPFFFITFSVYDGRRNPTLRAELWNVFGAVCVSALALAGLLFLTFRGTSRILFVAFVVLDLALLLGVRIVWWGYRRYLTGYVPTVRHRVLIVGAGPVGTRVAEQLQQYAGANLTLVGFVDDDGTKLGQEYAGLPVLGTVDQIEHVVTTLGIREAVLALPLHAHERLIEVCRLLQRLFVDAHVVPDLFSLSFPNATLDGFGGIPVIHLGRPGLSDWQSVWKRAFDGMAAGLTVVVLSPLLALTAVLIRLESRGPVLFRQERIGENGHPFTMFKFRSMRVDVDDALHREHVTRLIEENRAALARGESARPLPKLVNDPRVTRIGAFLRQTSLDELPQLFNVLRGEMSLVGPRPPLAYEVELYDEWHRGRLQAPPGITGLWQVRGRSRVSFDEMVRMDIDYIQRQSIWLDIKILLQTSVAVLTGRGAG